MKKRLLTTLLALGTATWAGAQCTPDITPPVALCQSVNAYLDGTGNVTVNASDVDAGSLDLCQLSGVFFVQQSYLVFTATNGNTVYRTDVNGSNTAPLYSNAAAGTEGPVGIEYEPTNGNIYYGGGNQWEFYEAAADGSGAPAILSNTQGMCCEHHDCEVDVANSRIFFTTSGDGVYVGNLNGSGVATQIHVPASGNVVCVEYDPATQMVYGVNVNDEIFRMNDNGTGYQVLYDFSSGASSPRQVAIDPANNKIWWTNQGSGDIMMGSMDGVAAAGSIWTAGAGQNLYGIHYDAGSDVLYWTEFGATDNVIVGNADGTGSATTLVSGGLGGVRDVTLIGSSTPVTSLDFTCDNLGPNTFEFYALDTAGNADTCSGTITVLDTMAPTAMCQNATVYLDATGNANLNTDLLFFTGTQGNGVWTLNLSDNTTTQLYTNAASAAAGPVGIDYVAQNGMIYYGGGNNAEVLEAMADGTGSPTMIANSAPGNEHHDVVVDYANNRYFYTGGELGIYEAALDGTGSATNLWGATSNSGPSSVDYDAGNQRLYFNEVNDSHIYGMNDDGTGFDTLYTNADGVNGPRQVAIDANNNRIYWTNQGTGSIMMGSLDGTMTPVTVWSGLSQPYGLFLDVAAQTLYWTEFGAGDLIVSGAANGSGSPTLLASGSFGSVRGICKASNLGGIALDAGSNDNCAGLTITTNISTFDCSDISASTDTLVITAAYDGPLAGGTPKGIELYVINDIPDLSQYGLGSANNGGGSDGEEFTFPAVPVSAGTYIYVATDSVQFNSFFGFFPDYNSGAMLINGDDAVELFHSGTVIDVFGDINVDGTGQPWEYLDGWAYRNNGTGPDGTTFQLANWSFSGINALDGEIDNATASTPVPVGTYSDGSGVMVTMYVTDGSGNMDSCMATVTVQDTLGPNFMCLNDTTVFANDTSCSAMVSWTPPTATDNCGGAVTYTSTHNPGDVFLQGTTTVTYTATDVRGNSSTCSFDITVNTAMGGSDSTIHVNCNGDSTGSIDLTIVGAIGSTTYDWDNDGTGDFDDPEDLTGLMTGTYNVTVMDSIGCVLVGPGWTITEPTAIAIVEDSTWNPGCDTTDGAIFINVSGGTPGYTFDWDGDGFDDSEDIMNLGGGMYTVAVQDAQGCIDSLSITLTSAGAPGLTATATDEMLGGDGSIDLTITGGTPPIIIDWDNDGTGDNDDTEDLMNLTAGTYTVVVTDSTGCSDSLTVVVGSQVGIHENGGLSFNVYPNPTTGLLTVELQGLLKNATLSVYSVDGRVIHRESVNQPNNVIDLTGVETGVYVIEVISNNVRSTTRVILK